MDDIGSITLTLIYDVSINLGGFHIRMSKHSFNGIDVGIMFKLQGGKGMAKAMGSEWLSKEKQAGEDKT